MKSILIALFSVVFIWGCSNNPDVVTIKSGLRYNDIKVGTGVEAKNGDLVEINFKGWVIKDSSDLFSDWAVDSTKKTDIIADSYAMNQPIKILLGSENFIKGSEEGMIGMKAGGQRTIIIPSNLAYGPEGMGPIPPNSNIKVVIELVSLKEITAAKMWDVDSTLFKTTASGLKYAIIQEGEGSVIEAQKQVVVH
ncbi:MAG: FKBP-type peptidyl-prolyl cis-trans isomerase, partial [Ignavibacteria bacterium]|nr:FKBP-type peptidyl-prolyl cis-trans isomerase [Ignavibacteria bacterium]